MKKFAALALSLTLLFSASSCIASPVSPVSQSESLTEQGTDLYESTPNDQTKPDNDQPTNPNNDQPMNPDNDQPTNPDNDQPTNPDNDQPTEQLSETVVDSNRYYKTECIDPSTYTYRHTIYNAWGQAVYSETTNKYFEINILGEHIVDIETYSGEGVVCHRYFNVMSTSFDDSKEYQAVIAASTDYVAYLNDNISKVIVKSILDDSFYKEFQMPIEVYANDMPVFSASLSHDTLYMHYMETNQSSNFISIRFREDKSHSFANYNAILELVQDICTTLPTYEEQTDYAAVFGITDAQETEWLDKLFFSLRDLHPAKEEATLSTNHLKTVGYAIKDLNADGIHELVLLCEDYNVIAIFSMVNGKPVLLSHYSSEQLCVIDDQGLIYETQRHNYYDLSPRRLYRIAQGGASMELIIEIGTDGHDWVWAPIEKNYYKLINGQKVNITGEEYYQIAEGRIPYSSKDATKELSRLCFLPLDVAASSAPNTTVHQAYLDVLANKLKVYNVENDEYAYLAGCKDASLHPMFSNYFYDPSFKCALADLDSNSQNELILINIHDMYILRYYEGSVYLYTVYSLYNGGNYRLYTGGVCGYDSNYEQGEYQIRFEDDVLRYDSLWRSVYHGDPKYYIGEQEVTRAELSEYLDTLQRDEIAFTPLELKWNYQTISPQKALELASKHWRTFDGASEGAAGTSYTHRVLILADHGRYYHVVWIIEEGSSWADEESWLGATRVELYEELLVDVNTGECIPYGMDYIGGKG